MTQIQSNRSLFTPPLQNIKVVHISLSAHP